MCYTLYLGSDIPLPVGQFDPKKPDFYLSDTDYSIDLIRHFLSKKHIYYAGSHTDCGCGFFYNSTDEPEEYEVNKKSALKLVDVIKAALMESETVELLVSWADQEHTKPKKFLEMTPEQLIADEFPLDEYQFIVFRKSKS